MAGNEKGMDEGQKGGGVNVQGGDEKRGNQTEIWMPHCYEKVLCH